MLNKNQCRVILASGLMIGASMMFAGTAKAGNSGEVSGVVAARNSVDYTAPASNQALSPTASSALQLGSILVLSNSSAGWTVTVDSTNDGKLKLQNGTETINYTTISASGSADAPPPLTPNVTGAAANLATAPGLACATAPGCTYTLTATAESADGKPAGTYTDTLTFVITAP